MQNAFLRMGRIQFAKRYQNGQISNFSVTCSLVAVAPKKDQPDEILAVEFSGSDSAMAGISAALQENEEVSIVCPDQSRMRGLKFGNTEAICGMNDRLELNEKKAKTTANHRAKVKALFVNFAEKVTDGYVPILSNDPREVLFELAHHLVLPVESHWSGYLFQRLREVDNGILECKSFGVNAIVVQVKRDKIKEIISSGIKSGRLGPKENAPKRLQNWNIKDLAERRKRWIRQTLRPELFEILPSQIKTSTFALRAIEDACLTPEMVVSWQQAGHWGKVSDFQRCENHKTISQYTTPFRVCSVFKIGGEMIEVVSEKRTYEFQTQLKVVGEIQTVRKNTAA